MISKGMASYNEQINRIEQIVAEIESGELSIDQLTAKVKTATELLRECKKRLVTVEEEVNKILQEPEVESATAVAK